MTSTSSKRTTLGRPAPILMAMFGGQRWGTILIGTGSVRPHSVTRIIRYVKFGLSLKILQARNGDYCNIAHLHLAMIGCEQRLRMPAGSPMPRPEVVRSENTFLFRRKRRNPLSRT